MQRPCGRSVPSILEKHEEARVAGADRVCEGGMEEMQSERRWCWGAGVGSGPQ